MTTAEEYDGLGYVPLEDHGQNYVKPDWSKAADMIKGLEDGPATPPWGEALGIYLDDGTLLFRIFADGRVEVPDLSRLGEAAVIFFREVVNIARHQGYAVQPDPVDPEGWDG